MLKKPKPLSKKDEKFFAELKEKQNAHAKFTMECIERWLNSKESQRMSVSSN